METSWTSLFKSSGSRDIIRFGLQKIRPIDLRHSLSLWNVNECDLILLVAIIVDIRESELPKLVYEYREEMPAHI